MRILNLFAGIGGNRTLWGDEHEITAVEWDNAIAVIYHQRFPDDGIVVEDALEYMMKHAHEYDLICASPVCITHSRAQSRPSVGYRVSDFTGLYGWANLYDIKYQGLYVWENVVSTYHKRFRFPKPTVKLGRHLFWANFEIPPKKFPRLFATETYIGSDGKKHNGGLADLKIKQLLDLHQIPFNFSHPRKRSILRNCVDYRIGKYILECAERVWDPQKNT